MLVHESTTKEAKQDETQNDGLFFYIGHSDIGIWADIVVMN